MLRFFCRTALSVFFLSFFIVPVFAQQGEDESLPVPIKARDVGIYKKLNELPESIRRTKIFARGLHDLEHFGGFEGVDNSQARQSAFEQSKSDIIRDAMRSDKVAGSKLPIFANAWSNIGPTNTAGMTKSLA